MDIFTEKTILSVTRLTSLISELLEENLYQVWVEGEVSNLVTASSGHIYFTLKDSNAMLRCIMFRSSAAAIKFRPENGMSLVLRGRISVYDQRGEYQLVVEHAEPKGLGALQAAFIQLKSKLAAEGLFDQKHKKLMPALPERVAVVTSRSGAVLHDIMTVLARRNAAVELLIYPVMVQGNGAASEIARAVSDISKADAADVLIVGRGGGSLEDLWAFNEEIVARAVFKSRIPVISAVGHETDWTICDFVADLRAPTPSAAAELVSTAKEEQLQQLENLQHRLDQAVLSFFRQHRLRLDAALMALHDPSRMLGYWSQRCDDLQLRLELAIANLIQHQKNKTGGLQQRLQHRDPISQINQYQQKLLILMDKLDNRMMSILDEGSSNLGQATAGLHSLSPLQTMTRGYSIVENCRDGKLVRSSAEVKAGDELLVKFNQGSALCLVEESYSDYRSK